MNGNDAHPVFKTLKVSTMMIHPIHLTFLVCGIIQLLFPGKVKWNFTKFLVDRNGVAIGRYPPKTRPMEIESDIRTALGI